MKDLISRQDAIDALGTRDPVSDSWTDEYELGTYKQWKDDVEVLKKLPAVQTKQRLIPCEKCWHGCQFPIHTERRQDADSSGNMSGTQKELKCTETHSCDCERTETHASRHEWYMKGYRDAQRWIPFKTRPLTDEEKKEYPYYVDMLDCQLPENGQRILVNVKWNGHESVQMDEYYDDDGSYLDSGYEIGSEATAWMPLPEPYKGGQDE